jgi:hypothetical protein
VKGAANTTGWIFGECSTLQNNSAFLMGKFNSASTGLDGFCRDDSGTPSGDHRVSTGVAYDDTWHNIIWVQRDVGGAPKASLYIDGVLDPVALNPRYPITPNNTALGALPALHRPSSSLDRSMKSSSGIGPCPPMKSHWCKPATSLIRRCRLRH